MSSVTSISEVLDLIVYNVLNVPDHSSPPEPPLIRSTSDEDQHQSDSEGPKYTEKQSAPVESQSSQAQHTQQKPFNKKKPSKLPRLPKKKKPVLKSFGYAVSLYRLGHLGHEHNLLPGVPPRGHQYAAMYHFSTLVPGGIFLHWALEENCPVLAVATNSHPDQSVLNTPDRIKALKDVLKQEDDPQWIRFEKNLKFNLNATLASPTIDMSVASIPDILDLIISNLIDDLDPERVLDYYESRDLSSVGLFHKISTPHRGGTCSLRWP
ncbi:hypothetical protein BDN70DRAFT_926868 [Pholiota conissans]|uniref:Uncharacterized protein n=1 Tax=Pholiota conissans TaxID=109636 RepID=A0A9P5ZGV1_9AGAR|nr:hypothetical protein BDN70DRAFT_926868 [Pholiota conissans]